MTLGQRIQELRKQQGLSQEALGEALGVSRQAVSKWELDNGIPELDKLISMSRLFGVTVGQLLGVEGTPNGSDNDSTDIKDEMHYESHEDKTEEILRRYAQQTDKTHESARRERLKWLIAAAAAVVAVFVIMFAQLSSLKITVKLLRSDLSNLRVNVSNSQSNLTGQIRNTIYDVLTEEANLLSTFKWEIVGFDLTQQTATVRLSATMKEYTAGSVMQFCAQYKKTDGTQGQTACDWVAGPDFCVDVTLPLNYHTAVSIRVKDVTDNIREQALAESIYSLHPDNFCLNAYNLTAPFAVSVKGFGYAESTPVAEVAYVTIESPLPHLFVPTNAELRAFLNGSEIMCEELTVTQSERDRMQFNGALPDGYCKLTLKNGDKLSVRLTVTDSLGRVQEFFDSMEVADGELKRSPMAAPVDSE